MRTKTGSAAGRNKPICQNDLAAWIEYQGDTRGRPFRLKQPYAVFRHGAVIGDSFEIPNGGASAGNVKRRCAAVGVYVADIDYPIIDAVSG